MTKTRSRLSAEIVMLTRRSVINGRIRSLSRAGLRFRNTIEIGPGGKQIQVLDPDGNPIELFEPAS
jgi:hypothetical protein